MTGPPDEGTPTSPLDRFFDTLHHLRPVDATFIGVHDLDHRWPDWSPAGHERMLSAWRAMERALAVDRVPDDALTPGDWPGIDTAIAHSHCELQVAELTGAHFSRGNPSLAVEEVAFGIIGLVTRDFLPAEQRASWLVQRLRQAPEFLAGALATMRERRIPATWREKALREARATERLLDEGLPLWCRAMELPPDRSANVQREAHRALGGVSAFAEALAQLPESGVDAAPCGEEFLAVCLTRGHWIERAPDDVLREAGERWHLERARLDQMVRAVGARDVAEVQQRLASRHPAPDAYYRAFAEVRDACQRLSDERKLVTWPDAPIRYVPIPEWTRMAAPSLYYLYYRSPAPLAWPAVHDYVVTPIEGMEEEALARHLRAWNDSVIKLNHVVHHGALGHHVQNWYASRSPSHIGRFAATDCANRIAMLQGGTMAEGWACYATDLMDDAGFLTADERVAEQHTRVRMLARAINDVEFHVGRRSLDAAVRFYAEEVGMTVEAARGEAVRNSMHPGTAMMYWLGTQAIHDLRSETSRRLGDAFDLRAFHDEFLRAGAIPVALNARLMLRNLAAEPPGNA